MACGPVLVFSQAMCAPPRAKPARESQEVQWARPSGLQPQSLPLGPLERYVGV